MITAMKDHTEVGDNTEEAKINSSWIFREGFLQMISEINFEGQIQIHEVCKDQRAFWIWYDLETWSLFSGGNYKQSYTVSA